MKKNQFNEVLRTSEINWKTKAAKLAEQGIPFGLEGFSFAHDSGFYEELPTKYGLRSSFNPNLNRAYFWKGEAD